MKKDNDKSDKGESRSDFFGLGGFLDGLERLVDLAGKLEKEGNVSKEGEINLDQLRKGMKGVYGFSVRTAAGGSPHVETFGNIKKTEKGPVVEDEREPITDVFNETNELVVTAEMPGVEQDNIKIEVKEDMLDISAETKDRKYHKELLLPEKVNTEDYNWKYNNGILEIRLKK